jgi:polar amino acid transport system substrate-binding protein
MEAAMKYISTCFTNIFIALLIFSTSATQAMEFVLCDENVEVYPWTLKDGHGLNTVLLKMAAEKTGTTFRLVRATWENCLREVESGKVHGAYSGSYSDKRARFASFPFSNGKLDETRRLMTEEYVLYRQKGSSIAWDGKQISGTSNPIGVQKGYSIGSDLANWGATVDDQSTSPEELMRKLIAGKFDAVAVLSYVAYDLAKKPEFFGKVEKVTPPLIQKAYFLFFNKVFYSEHAKEIDALWAAIAEARESARYKAIESAVLEK